MKKQSNVISMRLLFIICLGFVPLIGSAQLTGSCAEKLEDAQSYFDRGQVELIPNTLSECMKSGFNREESLAAYRLLIQVYLFEDKLEMADSTMLAFLKENPEYQVSPTDHISFIHLFNKFRVKPVLHISFHMGTNLPYITFINPVTVASEPGTNSYNTKALNLFTSIEAKYELSEKLELNIEAGYSQLAYTNIESFLGFGETNYNEIQRRVEIPLSVTYNLRNFGKFTPYGRFGIGTAFTLGSTAKAEFIPNDINNINSHTGSDIDRKDSRIAMDVFTQFGAGIKFKIPGGYIFTEVRSNFGILNQATRGGDSSDELLYYYYHVDDDFHINSLNFSVGYTQLFYKPSKKNE